MSDIEEIEAKLDELIDAHRALAAQHEALFLTSQVMFALVNAPLPIVLHILLNARHSIVAGKDLEYQQMVDQALNSLLEIANGLPP